MNGNVTLIRTVLILVLVVMKLNGRREREKESTLLVG